MTTTAARTGLLLLDYQVALCEEGPYTRNLSLARQVQKRGVLQRAVSVLDAARSAGLFIAHVRLAFEPTYALRTNRSARFDAYIDNRAMLADSPEAQIVDLLKPSDGEPVVDKMCVDPFVGTPLLHVVHAAGIRKIVIGGVATNLVVESTARHGTDAGLDVTVVEDMCASFDSEAHQFSMTKIMPMFATVRSADDVVKELA
jgi:nicotinamidase-related amidase